MPDERPDGDPPPPGNAGRRAEQPAAEPAGADGTVVDREALAAQALARARADALARSGWAGRPAQDGSRFAKKDSPTSAPASSQPARRARRDDPAPLDSAIDGLISDTGWELSVATGSVIGRWAQIVGPELAAHTAPGGLADGEFEVTADSTAWATQLRLLAADLVRRLNAELGHGTVRRVKVIGPGAGSRQSGQWRVRGGRGPRDTYG